MSVVKYFWLFVKLHSDAMTAQVANYSVAVFLGMFLHCLSYIAYITERFGCFGAHLKTLFGDTHKLFFFWSGLTDDKHTAGISIIAVYDGGHVHVDDISFLQYIFWFRYAVANHFVDAGTHTLGIALIVEAGGNGIMVFAILHTDVVYLLSVHSFVYLGCHCVQTTSVDDTALTNTFNLFGRLNELTCRHEFSSFFQIHHLQVQLCGLLSWQTMPSFLLEYHCIKCV